VYARRLLGVLRDDGRSEERTIGKDRDRDRDTHTHTERERESETVAPPENAVKEEEKRKRRQEGLTGPSFRAPGPGKT